MLRRATPPERGETMQLRGSLHRPILLALGLGVGFVGTLLSLAFAIERAGIEPPVRQADTGPPSQERLDRLGARPDRRERRVVMLGDSMLMAGAKVPPSDVVPARLEQQLDTRLGPRTRARIVPFAHPGVGYSFYYFFAGRIAAAAPDAVVMEINPVTFAKAWRTGRWVRTDLVGWLGARRLPEAFGLPLHRLGLTADRMLWLVACVELGCEEAWEWTQRRQLSVGDLYAAARTKLYDPSVRLAGIRDMEETFQDGPHGRRWRPRVYTERFGYACEGVPEDDVSFQLLGAAIRHLTSRGVPTLAYVTPINVEHMDELGVCSRDGLGRTFASLASVVREAGGRFVDLHDLLGDADFRDAPGHLTFQGDDNGTLRLVRELTVELAPLLRADARARH